MSRTDLIRPSYTGISPSTCRRLSNSGGPETDFGEDDYYALLVCFAVAPAAQNSNAKL